MIIDHNRNHRSATTNRSKQIFFAVPWRRSAIELSHGKWKNGAGLGKGGRPGNFGSASAGQKPKPIAHCLHRRQLANQVRAFHAGRHSRPVGTDNGTSGGFERYTTRTTSAPLS